MFLSRTLIFQIKVFYFLQWTLVKNHKNYVLFHLKSIFRSQYI